MSTPKDVEHRLDAEHIRSVCRAVHPTDSINVTQIDGSPHEPPYVCVDVELRHSADQYLRQVGYLTLLPKNRNGLVVTGWSTAQLNIRAAALTGILARWRDALTDTAARAVDIYALTHWTWSPTAARTYAVNTALYVHEHEAKLVTGPHAAHDPHVRPYDDAQARLIDENQRLEQAIAEHLDHARRVAGYAIDAYAQDLNVRSQPADARAWAITDAVSRYSADIRREYAERRAASQAPSGSLGRDHPATVAANDQPADTATPGPTASADSADTTNTAGTADVAPLAPRRRTP